MIIYVATIAECNIWGEDAYSTILGIFSNKLLALKAIRPECHRLRTDRLLFEQDYKRARDAGEHPYDVDMHMIRLEAYELDTYLDRKRGKEICLSDKFYYHDGKDR